GRARDHLDAASSWTGYQVAMMPNPRMCPTCRGTLIRMRLAVVSSTAIHVRTWCRLCGSPAVIQLTTDYPRAVRYLEQMNDQAMVHAGGGCVSVGGWGVHWRLDEVLE